MAIGTTFGNITLYNNIMNPNCALKFSCAHGEFYISGLSFSETHFACSDWNGKVGVYSLEDFSQVYSYQHKDRVNQIIITNKFLISVRDYKIRIVNVLNWKLIHQIKREGYSRPQIATFSNNILTVGDIDSMKQYKVDDNCQLIRQMYVKGHNICSILPVHSGEESLFWVGTKEGCLLIIDMNRKTVQKKFQFQIKFLIVQIKRLQEWIVVSIKVGTHFHVSLVGFKTNSLEDEIGEGPLFKQIVPFGDISINFVARGENLFYYNGKDLKKIHVEEIRRRPSARKLDLYPIF